MANSSHSGCVSEPTDKPRNRRWLRFSIRTLLVAVTVVCIWLAYYVDWQRQRSRAIADDELFTYPLDKTPRPLPWGLRVIGEQGYDFVGIQRPELDAKIEKYKSLFPEADVIPYLDPRKMPGIVTFSDL